MSNEKVFLVDNVKLTYDNQTSKLVIKAIGTVLSTGYYEPKLVLKTDTTPSDCILEYDFEYTPPSDQEDIRAKEQAVKKIEAELMIEDKPNILGVRVWSANNCLEDKIQGRICDPDPDDEHPVLEDLMGAEIIHNTVKIRVKSNGGTSKDSFAPHVMHDWLGNQILEFYRKVEDKQEYPKHGGIELTYSFEELGLSHDKTVTLRNSIVGGHA